MSQPNTSQDISRTKYSYIDKSGKVVIDAGKYDSAGDFSAGVAAVYLEDKGWGFIDMSGNEVIEPRFEGVGCFSEGLAGIQINGMWGFIDKVARLAINPQYKVVNCFS